MNLYILFPSHAHLNIDTHSDLDGSRVIEVQRPFLYLDHKDEITKLRVILWPVEGIRENEVLTRVKPGVAILENL